MKKYFKLMRVHHYIKNLLIFFPLACGGELFTLKFLDGIKGFVSFCAISSMVYIFNDIQDVEKDRMHPTKCKRPLASGSIQIKNAKILLIILLTVAVVCNISIFRYSSSVVLFLYAILNLAYSMGLKNIPLVDVSILVSGFLFRILYGALITDIEISNWLYLTVIAFSFYFALGKRRNELRIGNDGETRKVLLSYSLGFLEKNMYMCLALANTFYALWSMDENTLAMYGNNSLIFTVPIVLIITMKYSLDIEGDGDGDPVEVLIHDKALMVLCLIYGLIMVSILYLRGPVS